MSDPIRITSEEVLSDDWATLTKIVFDYRRRDGRWESQVRQVYDRGDGAVILPYDAARGTVLLVRQFRTPAYKYGHPEPLIEACAGLLDADDPETCIRKEAQEELGYRLDRVTRVFEAFMSPGPMAPATGSGRAAAIRARARTSRSWSRPWTRPWPWSPPARSSTPRPSCCCST
jgi:nudix-type nucleoside diphosphatase (YffH/AdpP family)